MGFRSIAFVTVLAVVVGAGYQHRDSVLPLVEPYLPLLEPYLELVEPYRVQLAAGIALLGNPGGIVPGQAARAPAARAPPAAQQAACGIDGNVAGCGCDYASTESLIQHELMPVLSEMVKLPYFRYFKVNLYCDCEFWPGSGMCFSQDCCVEACEDSEIPEPWRKELTPEPASSGDKACSDPISPVDRSVDSEVAQKLRKVPNWGGLNNPWVPEDDEGVEYVYVNLQLNPERYTGYKGEDARRIWQAIYSQSAFDDVHGHDLVVRPEVLEKQVLYRLISGMHSSITTSIIQNYYNETAQTWGPNLPFFKARFVGEKNKVYVENLYFTFLFLMRAVMKAGPTLRTMNYKTGCPNDDAATEKLMLALQDSPALHRSCGAPFDEGMLWQDREPAERGLLEAQLQVAFHNITKIMDCVGCEKCKMWGKVQVLGIATSLKILFSQDGSGAGTVLHRNEVIALVNMLKKMADSIETVRTLNLMLAAGA